MFYQLSKNKNGNYVLQVFYDATLRNWHQVIEHAIEDAKLAASKNLTVIAKPWPATVADKRNLFGRSTNGI
jgi:hypothetical protein